MMQDMRALRQRSFEVHPDAKQILEMFIEWANEYENDAPLRLRYEYFFSDQFDLTTVDADLVLSSGRYLFLTVGDGGEGGPSQLVAHFDFPHADDGDVQKWALVDIVHRFDMVTEVIWNDARGGYVHSS